MPPSTIAAAALASSPARPFRAGDPLASSRRARKNATALHDVLLAWPAEPLSTVRPAIAKAP